MDEQKVKAKELESILASLDKNILKAKTLYDILHDIPSSFDLDTIYKMALYSAVGTLGADGGVLLSFDTKQNGYSVKYQLNRKLAKTFYKNDKLFQLKLGAAFHNAPIISIDDTIPELKKFMRSIKARLLIPIKIKEHFYGFLGIGKNLSDSPYNEPDMEFLDTLCSLVSISIENAESQRELNYKIFELSTLYEISKEFSSTLDINHIQTSIVFCCMGVVGAKRGAIFLYDQNSKSISMNHAINFPLKTISELSFKVSDALLTGLCERIEPFTLSNLKKSSRQYKLFAKIKEKLEVIADPLIIPQIIKKRLVGYLILAEKINTSAYTDADINLLTALSYQSSLAIINARSYQEVKELAKRNAALYEELKVATEQKLKSERLATLGMVVSTITHDIKNPLTSIRYFSALLSEDAGLDAKTKMNYGNIIESEIGRLVGMIEELLSFATGGGPLKIKKRSLKQILGEVFVVLERDFKDKKISIVKEINYDGDIYLDGEKIKLVLYNIAYNARDALNTGGEIRFQVRKSNGFVNISITDNGKGIPENIVETLFKPFVTHGKTKGTGLGLAISKKIVDDHNGSLTFTSIKNKGTTFNIQLPLKALKR